MTDLSKTKNTADTGVPQSDAMKNLSEKEKKALELQEHAEHQTGSTRENLQRKAADQTD